MIARKSSRALDVILKYFRVVAIIQPQCRIRWVMITIRNRREVTQWRVPQVYRVRPSTVTSTSSDGKRWRSIPVNAWLIRTMNRNMSIMKLVVTLFIVPSPLVLIIQKTLSQLWDISSLSEHEDPASFVSVHKAGSFHLVN